MDKTLNTTIEFEFFDGTKEKMTLFFYALYKLKNKKPELYKRYNEVMAKQKKGRYDDLEMITILYTAYACANVDKELMSEEEFMYKCGADRNQVANTVNELLTPKKHRVSEKRFENERKNGNGA